MPGPYMGGISSPMPFQFVNPQNPQMASMGMFPLQGHPGLGMQNPAMK